jgi:hypothetical protein
MPEVKRYGRIINPLPTSTVSMTILDSIPVLSRRSGITSYIVMNWRLRIQSPARSSRIMPRSLLTLRGG